MLTFFKKTRIGLKLHEISQNFKKSFQIKILFCGKGVGDRSLK
ncbi:hypothetical protein CKA32_006442 [Geitlerinema sp. FC II]|nr:hypothetical protein CKA32_006442 [Geitlerinema sp. FC II]